MKLSTKLALGTILLAVLGALAVWTVTVRGVLNPFSRSVFEAFRDEAVFVADRIESGERPQELSRALGLDVRMVRGGPRGKAGGREGRPPPRNMKTVEHGGRELVYPRGPRNLIMVQTDRGWVAVHRDLDLDRPGRRMAAAVSLSFMLIAGLAVLLGRMATRPWLVAVDGMDRIAGGDLAHRLDEDGPAEVQRMARAFNGMASRIAGLLESERQLLAGVSHELRTPLSRLRLELELLRDGGADSRRVDAMEGDLMELDDLIEQLLAVSRMQLGQRPVTPEWTDLKGLADEAVALAKVEGVSVYGEGQRSVDAGLMLRAMVNLLQNAGRYGAPPIELVVGAHAIEVHDRGPGVTEAQLAQLFTPFWRAEESRSKATGGLGLGLMLVEQVARLHGAEARASLRTGGGLTVGMYFDTSGG